MYFILLFSLLSFILGLNVIFKAKVNISPKVRYKINILGNKARVVGIFTVFAGVVGLGWVITRNW